MSVLLELAEWHDLKGIYFAKLASTSESSGSLTAQSANHFTVAAAIRAIVAQQKLPQVADVQDAAAPRKGRDHGKR